MDANFPRESQRREFLEAARRWGVPSLLLLRVADPATVSERLTRRKGSESDANWAVYQRAAAAWEELGAESRQAAREVPALPTRQEAVQAARTILTEEGLP